MANWRKCSEMSGNGHAALIPPTPVTAPRPARLANTTASLCAISTFCGAVPAPHRALTFARRPEISLNLRNGGNSWGSVWHAIFRETGQQHRSREETFSRRDPDRPLQVAAPTPLQVLL